MGEVGLFEDLKVHVMIMSSLGELKVDVLQTRGSGYLNPHQRESFDAWYRLKNAYWRKNKTLMNENDLLNLTI